MDHSKHTSNQNIPLTKTYLFQKSKRTYVKMYQCQKVKMFIKKENIQRFFSFFKWYRKTDPFTIRNGPSQFPNGPFHNWIKSSDFKSKQCNNVLKSAFFAHKLPFYRYYCLLPVCLKPVHHRTGKILVPDRLPAPRTLNVKRFNLLISLFVNPSTFRPSTLNQIIPF